MNGSYSVPTGSSRSPLMRMRQAERRQQDEQVHLGDAELDVLALRRELPVEGRGDALALEGVGHRLAREQAAPVHPGAEIGRDGDVGRGRDDARGEVAVAAAELVEDRAEAGLRRHHRLRWRPASSSGTAIARRLEPARRACARTARVEECLQAFGRRAAGPRTCPIRGRRRTFIGLAEGVHLRRRHQAGVVVLVAGERQAEALDRCSR